ncbi:hypothetical protein Pmani_033832 [Petrolisthes manimaculis]|uniref:Uncharacterized protein n=1 Tax=Petrolisthes manimaculis TaxID=1843537 RepID=A0AAE1NR48_9EUCA|nr:hypothetical protein Pmani_033832 [Petrolisthes manimaculis]
MYYRLLYLVVLVQLASALYYKPRPPICPVTNQIQYQNDTLEASEVQVVNLPLPVAKIFLNTIYKTSVLPIITSTCVTVTEAGPQLEVTDVQLVFETKPLTVVRVSTITKNVIETELEYLTKTGTNYETHMQTLPAVKTFHHKVTETNTQIITTTQTVLEYKYITLTVNKAQLVTEVVTEEVPITTVVAWQTQVELEDFTSTHSLTKMITQTICPPPISYNTNMV